MEGIFLIQFINNTVVITRVSDPGWLYPDPDPTFEKEPDLDSDSTFKTDPYPTFREKTDPNSTLGKTRILLPNSYLIELTFFF